MPTLWNVILPICGDAARFAWSHAKAAIGEPQKPGQPSATVVDRPPVLEPLPSLPPLEPLPRFELDTVTITEKPTEKPIPVTDSYAAEMEDTSIACVPCTRGHLSAMTVAADQAAATRDETERRRLLARVAAEALVMRQYDWTPLKLANARPDDRAAIQEIMPHVDAITRDLPMAPAPLVLAWAAVDESLRFARSPKPTDADRREVESRARDAEANLNYVERELLAPHRLQSHQVGPARRVLPLLREARHRLTTQGYSLEALEFAAARLATAVTELTPAVTEEQARNVAVLCRQCRDRFYRRVLAQMRERRAG